MTTRLCNCTAVFDTVSAAANTSNHLPGCRFREAGEIARQPLPPVDRETYAIDHGDVITVFIPLANGIDVHVRATGNGVPILICEQHGIRACPHVQAARHALRERDELAEVAK